MSKAQELNPSSKITQLSLIVTMELLSQVVQNLQKKIEDFSEGVRNRDLLQIYAFGNRTTGFHSQADNRRGHRMSAAL